MTKAHEVLQFIYYFSLCLGLLFSVISYLFGPVLARYAIYASVIAVFSLIAALIVKVWQHG